MEVYRRGQYIPNRGWMMKFDTTFPEGTKVTKTSETAKSAGSRESVRHSWVFDLSGCSVKQILDAALIAAVIRLQGRIRAAWVKSGTPLYPAGEVVVKLADLLSGRGTGIQPTVDSVSAAMATLKPEEIEALVAKYAKG